MYFPQVSNCLSIWLTWGKEKSQKSYVDRNENIKTAKIKMSTSQKQMSLSLAMAIPVYHRHLITSDSV